MPLSTFRSTKRRQPPPRGVSIRGLLIVLALAGAVGALAWYTLPKFSLSSQDSGPMLHTVSRGVFIHDITERGNVESASNVDIRCEVESRGGQGTMILELVPEGTYVTPGDILCKLDSSALEQELVQQQIICNTSEAQVIQAKNDYETAEIALEEYIEGVYTETRQEIMGKIFVAEESLRRADQTLAFTKKLYARGYVPILEVEANDFAVKDAQQKLDQAKTELRVLDDYTKLKTVKQLEADIKTTKAKWDSEQHSYDLDLEKLADVTSQIEKCTVVAPDTGQVVYANVTDRRGSSEIIIEEGGSVRERQVIFKLPDPKRMQVKAKINEASVAMVEEGMKARIRLDAFPDLELHGVVEKVNEYPLPTSFFTGNVKEYETTIRIYLPGQIDDPVEETAETGGLKPKTEGDGDEPATDSSAEEAARDAGTTGESDETVAPETTGSEAEETNNDDEPTAEDGTDDDPTEEDGTIEDMPAEEDNAEDEPNEEGGAPGGNSTELDNADEPKVELRPGMTAEVKIRVETTSDVLQVPVQAIVEHGGRNYCLIHDRAGGWSKCEVKIGSTNDKTVIIRKGLEEGDQVVIGASNYREKVDWPEIPKDAATGQDSEADQSQESGSADGPKGGGNPMEMFKGMDKNGDNQLTPDEAAGPLKANFANVDKNGDGSVDRTEFAAALNQMRGGGGGRPGGGGGGPGSGGGRSGGGQ